MGQLQPLLDAIRLSKTRATGLPKPLGGRVNGNHDSVHMISSCCWSSCVQQILRPLVKACPRSKHTAVSAFHKAGLQKDHARTPHRHLYLTRPCGLHQLSSRS